MTSYSVWSYKYLKYIFISSRSSSRSCFHIMRPLLCNYRIIYVQLYNICFYPVTGRSAVCNASKYGIYVFLAKLDKYHILNFDWFQQFWIFFYSWLNKIVARGSVGQSVGFDHVSCGTSQLRATTFPWKSVNYSLLGGSDSKLATAEKSFQG